MPEEPAHPDESPLLVIRARKGWELLDVADLWRYRELLGILAMRDIRVRYKQTFVGAAWALLQPLATMVVFTLIFTALGRAPVGEGTPYALSTYCALLLWQLVATSVANSGESLITNQQLVTKVYFPRVIIPVAPILAAMVDFAIAMLILIPLMLYFGQAPTWNIVAAPLFVLMAAWAALVAGLWLSALNALYRDLRFAMPFLIQMGFLVSPVVYETGKLVPQHWRKLYDLNPLVGILEGFRWSILGRGAAPVESITTAALMLSLGLITALVYFRRMERHFADRI